MQEIDYKQIIKRLKLLKKIKTDTALAEFLGVSQGAISMMKYRNSGNLELIITKCFDEDLNFLVFGKKAEFGFSASDSALFKEVLGIAKRNGELEKENEMLKAQLAESKKTTSSSRKTKAA